MDKRWNEIKTIWKEHPWLYILAGFVLGLLCFPFLQALRDDVPGFLQSLVPEAVGIVFTVLIIDRLYQRREHKREERELKTRLIRELGSRDNSTTSNAVRELRSNGWLQDGSLKSIDITRANLQGVDLKDAQLAGVRARETNLASSRLDATDLRSARLLAANLEAANLSFADLRGANLYKANLMDVVLYKTVFDKTTTLPDRTKWNSGTDILRYVDPSHPDFWRSDDPASPAYRGKPAE